MQEPEVQDFKVPKISKIYTNVVIWSADLNIHPIRGIKDLLTPLGVEFVDKSLAPDCDIVGTCAKDLKVLTKEVIERPDKEHIDKFQAEYEHDAEMQKVSHILCASPAAACELYMGLKKSLIVLVNERYESCRTDEPRWEAWNRNLDEINLDPSNVIAATNHYDAEYMRYFTALSPEYLPPYCGYASHNPYQPSRPEVLLEPFMDNKDFSKMFMTTFEAANERFKYNTKVAHSSELYPRRFNLSYAAAHPAVVFVPNQVTMFRACEYYAMAVPMFFPTLDLLTRWHMEYKVSADNIRTKCNPRTTVVCIVTHWVIWLQIMTNLTLNAERQRAAHARGETEEQVEQLGFGSPINSPVAGRFDPNNDRDRDTFRWAS